jgi:hypothetical protein
VPVPSQAIGYKFCLCFNDFSIIFILELLFFSFYIVKKSKVTNTYVHELYIIYKVQDYSVLYNNFICMGCHIPHMCALNNYLMTTELIHNILTPPFIKKRKYNNIGSVPKSNRRITERGKIDNPNTKIHDLSLFWL